MALIAGTRLGQYEIGARIGAGGMGEVYRARDRKLARDVAIKALPPALSTEPDRLNRFRREALILATLNHPNIGAIYGLEELDGASYLVLELIDGETLDERLSRDGPMAIGEVLRLASLIADALAAAHAKGITHRDIKPSNIKVTPEGRIKVLDFGIARSNSRSESQDDVLTRSTLELPLTETRGMIGTPPYMSPEQIRGQPTDQRTDVWAFGCVIYELLCGRQAFGRSTVPDTIADILQTEPDWSALPARVPADVRRLLRRCLEKDPSRRWQDFGEIRTELARAISAVGGREHERPWLALLLFALPVGVIALLALGRPDYLTPLEYSAYDSILRWSARLPPDRRVVIVDVDERSLAAIGRWPWRRDVIGRLVERLRDLGATTIALDMFFSEPDESSPIGPTGGASVRTRTPDELLADSLRGGRVVLGYGMTFDASAEPADDCKLHPLNLTISTSDETPRSTGAPFFEATGSLCNLESLAMAAGQSGFLNGTPDPDGILRRAPVAIGLNGRVYPSLALAAVMMATATANADLRVVPPNRASLAFGPRTVRLDGKSNLLLRFRGPKRTFPYISAVDVMTGDTSLSAIQDRIVFVGTTALGNREVVATPIDTLFVGVEVQATVADNLLQQDFVYRPANALTLESLAVVGLGVPIALLGVTFGLVVSALTGLAALAMLWTGAIWLLSASGAFLSPLYPTAGIVVAVLSVALGKIGLERRRADVAIRKVENTVLNR